MKLESSIVKKVLDLTVEIQQIPAPTFEERQRSAFIQSRFSREGLHDVLVDGMGNVYGRIPGRVDLLPLIVTAHLDTVFPIGTDLRVNRSSTRICAPGIGDNSLGVAGLFGIVWALEMGSTWGYTRETLNLNALNQISQPLGDLWLVANVGEEGLGDLRGMRAVVERFGEQVLAYLVLEGMALGQIYHRGLGVERYAIRVRTEGGHSWVDYGKPSAINELTALVSELVGIPLPAHPRTTLNVGVISGGTSVNTIASEAQLELDLRSEEQEMLNYLVSQVKSLVEAAGKSGVCLTMERVGLRPAGSIPKDHPLVLLAQRTLIDLGIQPSLAIGSTDANVPLEAGIPSICIGLSLGGGAHTVKEYIDTRSLIFGLTQLVNLVRGIYRESV